MQCLGTECVVPAAERSVARRIVRTGCPVSVAAMRCGECLAGRCGVDPYRRDDTGTTMHTQQTANVLDTLRIARCILDRMVWQLTLLLGSEIHHLLVYGADGRISMALLRLEVLGVGTGCLGIAQDQNTPLISAG